MVLLMLKNHDLCVILAPMSHLINLIFCTNFKILTPKMFFGHHRWHDLQIKSKICMLNLFEIMRMEISMSRFCYILAAIDLCYLANLNLCYNRKKVPPPNSWSSKLSLIKRFFCIGRANDKCYLKEEYGLMIRIINL